MNKSIGLTGATLSAFALLIVAARHGQGQIGGSLPAFVRLQAATPGTPQSGHSNITGTAVAGQFIGSGPGLTGLNAGNLQTGTVADARLSANVARRDQANTFGVGPNVFSNGFVGVGRGTQVTGAESFGIGNSSGNFDGMYVRTAAAGKPFYGYSLNGNVSAYSYVDGSDLGKWKFNIGSADRVTIDLTGQVGIGTTAPESFCDVRSPDGAPNRAAGYFVKGTGGNPASGTGAGVNGISIGPSQRTGVRGQGTSNNSLSAGVIGEASGSGTNYGIYGTADFGTANWAAWFTGNTHVTGTLSKGAGSFQIDHPLDPRNKYLYHSFVESPDMKNIYDGEVTTDSRGYATVTMPKWFQSLNRDFRYQLTVVDEGEGAWVQARVVRRMREGSFTLQTSAPNVTVSWQITGIRQDAFANAHRIPVEEDKLGEERGYYLHPTENGASKAMGIDFRRDEMLRGGQAGQTKP